MYVGMKVHPWLKISHHQNIISGANTTTSKFTTTALAWPFFKLEEIYFCFQNALPRLLVAL
jgi:hypothetical protein